MTCLIFEMCLEVDQWPGERVSQRWREKIGLDLEVLRSTEAEMEEWRGEVEERNEERE